jgi:hypothetical protein
MGRFPACVILSGVAASRSEAATESKDPFLHRDPQPIFSEKNSPKDTQRVREAAHCTIAVLRLRIRFAKRIGWLRSG